jgi:hypothetical protein
MKDFDPQWLRHREQQRLAAKRTVARGKARYIWLNGVLGWGEFCFVVMTVLGFHRTASRLHRPHFLRHLLFTFDLADGICLRMADVEK